MNDPIPNFDDWIKTRPQREKPPSRLNDLITFAEENKLKVGSTTGGRHNRGSKHYKGNAIDIAGSGAFTDEQVRQLSTAAASRGFLLRDERRRPKGQAVWGGPHVHIEAQDPIPTFDDFQQRGKPKQQQIPNFDDWAKDSGQNLPPSTLLKTTVPPVTPATATSVPKTFWDRVHERMGGQRQETARPSKQLFDPTIPDLTKITQQPAVSFDEDRRLRTEQQRATESAMTRLRGRAGAAADFKGEEYQNFLRLNRTLDNPRQREAFLELKAKQSVARAGSPFEALRRDDLESQRAARVAQIGTGRKALQVPQSAASGLARGVGSTLKGVATVSRKLVDQIADTRGFDTRDSHIYQLGEYIQQRVPELVRSNPDLEQEFWVGKAPAVVGQMAEFLLGGVATKSPKLAISVLGGSMIAGDAYDEVRRAGGTDEDAVNAGLLAGSILGPSELIGTKWLRRALSGTPAAATLDNALVASLRAGSSDAVKNAVQEIGQEYVQGRITGVPRSERELLEAALLGGIAGTVTVPVTLASQIGGRRGTQVEQETTPTTRTTDTQDRSSAQTDPRGTTAILDVVAERDLATSEPRVGMERPAEPQRFYHKDWGEVEVLEDQTGARPGRVRVAEVADPTKHHFPRRSDLSGRGNQRMVPVRQETQDPVVAENRERISSDEFRDHLMTESVGGNAGENRAAVNMLTDKTGRIVFIGNFQNATGDVADAYRAGQLHDVSAIVHWPAGLTGKANPRIERIIGPERVRSLVEQAVPPEWGGPPVAEPNVSNQQLTQTGRDSLNLERLGWTRVEHPSGEVSYRRPKFSEAADQEYLRHAEQIGASRAEAEQLLAEARGEPSPEQRPTFAVAPHRRTSKGQEWRITANLGDKEVGSLIFDDKRAQSVFVDESYRRRGIASEMYDEAARILGHPLERGKKQTGEGAAFRDAYDQRSVLISQGRSAETLPESPVESPVSPMEQGAQAPFPPETLRSTPPEKIDVSLLQPEIAQQRRAHQKPDITAAGFKSDLSLSQFVRKMGGIAPGEMFRGELDRIRIRETGTSGLVNQKAKQGSVPQTADIMMQAANDAGFRDPKTGQLFENPGDFLYAVERDVLGDKIRVSSGEEDFSAREAEYYTEQEARLNAENARIDLLESGRGAELYDRIDQRKVSDAEREEFRTLARQHGLSDLEIEDIIAGDPEASGELEAESGPRGQAPPQQLGFVPEGLEQQVATPPKSTSQRDALSQSEENRQAALNPARSAAQQKLEEIRRRGMTVDDYARQPDLEGTLPSSEEVAQLRELESGQQASVPDQPDMFGPGTMRVGEALPEVKERKFGKRFVEDERIAEEIRDIGTARYYEPIPNKFTVAEAEKLVEQRGIAESIRIIKDETNEIPAHIRSVMGQLVIQKLNRSYRNLKESNPGSAARILDTAVDLAEWQMDYGTRLGQGVQSFAVWARLTPEGMLLTYKRAAKKARDRHKSLFGEEVAEIVKVVNDDKMTDAERAEALKKLFKTNRTARKIKTDFDRIIEAAKTGKLTDEVFYEIVGERLGLPGYDREVAQKITDLALEIEAAPEGLPRNKIVLELQKFIAQQKGFDVWDLPLGIFYGNILSGYNTHAVNFSDTGLNVLSEINGLALNNPRAAAKIYSGLLRGFAEGRFDAILELTQGRMVTDGKWLEVPRLMEVAKFGQKGGVPIKTASKTGQIAKRISESKIAIPLNAYKYVTRAMAASDALMFRAAKEARATLLAYRMAQSEGLSGSSLESRVRNILALDREADFMAQAHREGFTGNEAQFRAKELRELTRDKDLSSDAAEFAGEATYNHTPHGTLGMIAERVGKLAEDVKPLKLFVPFTRIVANVTNRGLNYTPYGYKRAFMGWGFGSTAEPLTAEGRRLMLTRATIGTAGLVLMGALQEAGLFKIHGNGPSDREKRRQLQQSGWRPYSIQIGDVYVSYVYTPVGLGLSILGNASDSQRYNELSQKDAGTRMAYSVARLGSTIFSQSFLSGLSRLFGALSERPDVSVTAVKQTLGGTVSAMAVPNIARDIHRLFDNTAYQSNTLMEDLIRNTPYAAIALRPQLNAFGEPVKLQRQRFVDKLSSDPAWRFVIQKGLRVPVPGRTIEIEKGKRITPEQYYKLLQTTGPQVRQWILDNTLNLEAMTETEAQDELSDAATKIRKRALDEMRGKMVKPLKPEAPPKPEAPLKP